LLIKLVFWIGFWATFAIVVGTALLGGYVLHHQTRAALKDALGAVHAGHMPMAPLLDAAGLSLAGILLVAPGVIADCLGFTLLIPGVRRWAMRWAFARLLVSAVHGRPGGAKQAGSGQSSTGQVIEGEFTRLDEQPLKPEPNGDSGAAPRHQ
jgi:UPF0716 protein FxsA